MGFFYTKQLITKERAKNQRIKFVFSFLIAIHTFTNKDKLFKIYMKISFKHKSL